MREKHSHGKLFITGIREYVYLAKEKYGEFVKAYMRYLRNGVVLMAEYIMRMLSIPLYLFEGY